MTTGDISDPHFAVRAVLLFASAGVLLSSLEWVALFREFQKDGVYDWDVRRLLHRFASARYICDLLRVLGHPRVVCACLATRICASAWCVIWCVLSVESAPWMAMCAMSLTSLYINYRTCYGLEGSDQMLTTVCMSLTLGVLSKVDCGEKLALYFIAAQSVLCYFVAGVSKVCGSAWRSGEAVRLIVNTRTFGRPYFAEVFSRRPALGRAAAILVVVIECSFPLAVIMPLPATLLLLAFVCGLHLANCVVLGLNVFLWSFVATYPAILFTAHHARELM